MDTPTQMEPSSGEEKIPDSLKSIKDIAKKRLRAISAQNKKLLELSPTPSLLPSSPNRFKSSFEEVKESVSVVQKSKSDPGSTATLSIVEKPKVPLTLYSDEESDIDLVKNEEKVTENSTERDNGSPVKRVYRTERTHSTSSELSEGEIVDDDDDETIAKNLVGLATLQPTEHDRTLEQGELHKKASEHSSESRASKPLASGEHGVKPKYFDLRQKLQHSRGRIMQRPDPRRLMYGQRGRGRWFRGGPRMVNRFDRRNSPQLMKKRDRSISRSRSRSNDSKSRRKRRKSDSKHKSSEKSKKSKSDRKKHKEEKNSLKQNVSTLGNHENQPPKKTLKEKLGLGVLKETSELDAKPEEKNMKSIDQKSDNSDNSNDNLKFSVNKENHESKKKRKHSKSNKHKDKHSKSEKKRDSSDKSEKTTASPITEKKIKPIKLDIDSILSESDEEIKELKRKLKEMQSQLKENKDEVVRERTMTPEIKIKESQKSRSRSKTPTTPKNDKRVIEEPVKDRKTTVKEKVDEIKLPKSNKNEKELKSQIIDLKPTTPKKEVKLDKKSELQSKEPGKINCEIKMIDGSTKVFPTSIIRKTKTLPVISYSPKPDLSEVTSKKSASKSDSDSKIKGPKDKAPEQTSIKSVKPEKDQKLETAKKKLDLEKFDDRPKDQSKDRRRDRSKDRNKDRGKEPKKNESRDSTNAHSKHSSKDSSAIQTKEQIDKNSEKRRKLESPEEKKTTKQINKSLDSRTPEKPKNDVLKRASSKSKENKKSKDDDTKQEESAKADDSSKTRMILAKKENKDTVPKKSAKTDEKPKTPSFDRTKCDKTTERPTTHDRGHSPEKISSSQKKESANKGLPVKDKKVAEKTSKVDNNNKQKRGHSRSKSRGEDISQKPSDNKSNRSESKTDRIRDKAPYRSKDFTRSKSLDKKTHKNESKPTDKSKASVTKSKPSVLKPTLSFLDDLEEVQGLKKPKSRTPSPAESPSKLNQSPDGSESPDTDEYAANWEEDYSPSRDPGEVHKYRKKITKHAEMLKEVESKVESILAPLNEIEKLANERNSMRPEDLLNNIIGLVTPDKKIHNKIPTEPVVNSAVAQEKPEKKPIAPTLYDEEFTTGEVKRAPITFKVGKVAKNSTDVEKCLPTIPLNLPLVTPSAVKQSAPKENLETEYETFINSLVNIDEKSVREGTPPLPPGQKVFEKSSATPPLAQDSKEKSLTPKKKSSRSLSSSTASTTSTDSTDSSSASSSESSSSSSDDDSSSSSSSSSSPSSSSSSDSETTSKPKVKKIKKSKQVPVPIISSDPMIPEEEIIKPKPVEVQAEAISSTNTETGMIPLPANREVPIKIQLASMQKIHSIKKELDLDDSVPEPEVKTDILKKNDEKSDEKLSKRKSRSKSHSPRRTDVRRSKTDRDKRRSRSRSTSKDSRSRRKSPSRRSTRSHSRDRFNHRRSISPVRNRRYNSRDRHRRRSPSYSPRRYNRRRSPRRPRSPRTPESPFRDRSRTPNRNKRPRSPVSPRRSRTPRSASISPNRKRRGGSWNRYDDKNRPPSPQSDTESPVTGFKRSLADSTISDAELENQQQQLYKIQTHMTNEGFYSYIDPDGQFHNPAENDSPKRISLDERINMALGHPEPPKYGYQPPDDYAYRYNYAGANNIPIHPQMKPQYQYDPRFMPPQGIYPPMQNHIPPQSFMPPHGSYPPQHMMHNRRNIPQATTSITIPIRSSQPSPQCNVVQKGNVLEIVPEELQPVKPLEPQISIEPPQPIFAPPLPPIKQKILLSTEELQARKEKKLELKKKRKADRDKKRLEKKMRKEKLKLEIKRLVSMGVKDDDLSSEEDIPFDDITKKGMYGTKDKGILKETSVTKPVKKGVRFADGVLPGDGSSYSDNDILATSPMAQEAEKKKRLKKRRKHLGNTTVNEKKENPEPQLAPFPPEAVIPAELDNVPPPPPPDGNPPNSLPQPRFLYPNRVPMLFFHLLRPQQLPMPMPAHNIPPGSNQYHPGGVPNFPQHLPPGSLLNLPLQQQQQQPPPMQHPPMQPMMNNKLTPTSRMNQLPPTFGPNIKV